MPQHHNSPERQQHVFFKHISRLSREETQAFKPEPRKREEVVKALPVAEVMVEVEAGPWPSALERGKPYY